MRNNKPRLEVAVLSETGYVRNENQDRMSGCVTPFGFLYIVADGMGGHKGGSLAAELTVQCLRKHIAEAQTGVPVEEVIRQAFARANEAVYEKGHSGDATVEDMGSTTVLLLVSGPVARVAHVGDSRAYLFRNGGLGRLTTDHTRVQRMVEAGMLKPEEAADHPDSSILERAVGNRPELAVDISDELPIQDGDAFLLCSDGLSGYASDKEIEYILNSDAAVQEIPALLFSLALEKGGKDNVTIQYIQCGTRSGVRGRDGRGKKDETSDPAKKGKGLPTVFPSLVILMVLVFFAGYLGYLSLGGSITGDARKAEQADIRAKPPVDAVTRQQSSSKMGIDKSDKMKQTGPGPANSLK